MDTGIEGCAFTGLLDGGFHFAAGFFNHFLDSGGMNPSVGDEFFQSQTGNFTADGIEAGDANGFGRIVNDEVCAGEGFDGADVPSFTTDDASLHFLAGQVDDGDGDFGYMVCGTSLDGKSDDFACLIIGNFLELGFQLGDFLCLFVLDFGFQLADQLCNRFFSSHAGNLLEGFVLFFLELGDLFVQLGGFLQLL